MNEYKLESYHTQKARVKEYIEECFIRQIRVDMNESDDLIAHYCKIAPEEKKTILSADKDLLQLVNENTTIYSPIAKVFYTHGKKVKIGTYEMPACNILPYKIITGDKSDNINGIYYFGEKTLIKYFPEFLDKPVNINDILTKARELLKEDEKNTALKNLISGKTKDGIYGEEFFQINEKIVDLQNPLISDDGKGIVEQYYADTLDPEGRGYKNLIRMMTDDGFFKYLGKSDDEFLRFIQPFMKLTRKEKRKFRNEK
jgi:5'-3' exonuclease